MFRATGAGKVYVQLDLSYAGVLTALLYNFDFDDFSDRQFRPLKPEHANYLTTDVLPLLRGAYAGNIWLVGSASRIGTKAWNMELSQTRTGRVQAFLLDRGVDTERIQPDAIGNESASTYNEDDPKDRSVWFYTLPSFEVAATPVPLPRPVPSRPKTTRQFKIAMITGLSVSQAVNAGRILKGIKLGGGPAADGIFFMIWDWMNSISCLYFYFGLGLGVGLSILPSVSATTHGPWTSFTTEKPFACWQFRRKARFTTAGIGSHSVNWISLETPPGVNDVDSLSIETGTTLGLGMSTTVGDFIRVAKPERFSGP